MKSLLFGFITIVVGLLLTVNVITFTERVYNALNDSSIQAIRDLADFSTLIVLVWIIAIFAGGAALIYTGFKGKGAAG